MGKAPTKTERKQSEKKRLNEEKKLLLREMRGDGNTDMRTPGPDHTVIKKKLREIQKGEKRAIQEVLDLSKQRPKRRRKEVVQCKYTFNTHIERYLLPSIERVNSLTPLKNLLEGSHTILFFSVYNTGSTSFGVRNRALVNFRKVKLLMMILLIIIFLLHSFYLYVKKRRMN